MGDLGAEEATLPDVYSPTHSNTEATQPLNNDSEDHVSIKSIQSGTMHLKRTVGLFSAVALILGSIVGSGIFVSPKGVLLYSGSVGLALVIWTICGFICLLGALCFAELGCCLPSSGGMYSYIQLVFGNLLGFLYLWTSLIITFPAANAVMALTFAHYVLYPFFDSCDPPDAAVRLIAAAGIALLTFVNCASVVWAARVQDVFAILKTLALVLIIITGLVVIGRGGLSNFENAFENSSTDPGRISLAFYSGLFSYSGWYALNFLVEELKNPYQNLPRAIWISMPLVTVIYVLANTAYFAVLTMDEVLRSHAVAVTFSDRMFGVMSWTMPLFVAFSTFGSLNGALLSVSRMFFVGAREGQLPGVVALIQATRFTPMPAVLVEGIISLLMLVTSDVIMLINYVVFLESLSFFACVFALIYMRWKWPNMKKPLKVPIILPVFFLLICVALLVFPVVQAPVETGISLAIMVSGIPVYWVGVCWKEKPKSFVDLTRKFTILVQKLINGAPEDFTKLE